MNLNTTPAVELYTETVISLQMWQPVSTNPKWCQGNVCKFRIKMV